MPMLGKKLFVREKPPKDLRPDEELFYCKTTHEIFREYEEFFDRVILCNSLVWTCSTTGRNGLTYSEAVDSENNARQTLKKFPEKLKKPLLFLATLTERGRLNDMCDDVFNFVKDRYFVGETVDVSLNGIKKSCEIKRVISYEKEAKVSPKSETKKKTPTKTVSPDKIKYEVEEKEQRRKIIVKNQCISRPKGTYTKPHSKLFLKHHAETVNGIWKVKEDVVKKYNLKNFDMRTVFPCPLPKYATSPNKKKTPVTNSSAEKHPEKTSEKKKNTAESSGKKSVQGKLNFRKESEEGKRKAQEQEQEEFIKHRLLLEEERQRRKEELKKRLEDEKERLREQKLKEREQRREEKKKMAEYLSSWKKPRDDLECDDLKELPKPVPIDCNIPQDCFGDAVMILEFLSTFKDLINLKDSFPQGFTFEQLEKALLETDIQGYFNDIVQLLLTSVFQLQEWEDEKISDSDKKAKISEFKDLTSSNVDEAATVAAAAAAWPQVYHGTILRNMQLDSFSITEVLRLHILASGSDKSRSVQFGLTGFSEDPGLYFKMEESELVKKLATTSIFQLSCEERVKILNLLIHQIASCPTLRNLVEDNLTKTKPLRHELKHLRWAYARQKKENEALSNVKKKPDDKNTNEEPKEKENATEGGEREAEDEEKENIDTLTPEEKAALEEKRQKEEAKRKNDFLRKERELLTQIQKLQSSYQVAPIGRDRSYRRFWVFHSLPGVFVEDDDKFVGKCLPKETPQTSSNAPSVVSRTENTVNNIRKYLQQIESPKNGSSDKENDILLDLAIIQSDMTMPLKDRNLSDLNPRVDFKKGAEGEQNCLLCKEKVSELHSAFPRYCPHEKNSSAVSGLCTASIETCTVHNVNAPRTKWSFFYTEEDLENLLSTLNKRGFREGPLREALIVEKENIRESMTKCQCNILNKTLPTPQQLEVRKSQRHQRKSDFANMKPQEALELTLRDMILELEHRIHAGGLGSLKVSNRIAWREAIELSSYSSPLSADGNVEVNGIKDEKTCEDQIVKDLALALLQISQGIETKYLHPPLGESDNFKQLKEKALNKVATWETKQKAKDSENNDSEACPKVPESPLKRWQESLMECTSLSQLFVHLGTVERSVAWSRSVLKAHCRICRRRGDGENMLLCDGCNRGHHLYCLKPPLEEIPQGDWYCLSCKPQEKTTPQKKTYAENDESESENESEESEDDDEVEEIDSDEDAENSENDVQDPLFEVCESCGVGGTVICCDRCPDVYHPECIGLRRIPRGEWLCPRCTKKEETFKKTQKHSPTGSYVTRAACLISNHEKAKKSSVKLRTKIQIKASNKRKRQESSDDSDSEPVAPKRSRTAASRRKRQDSSDDSDSESVTPKPSRTDSALNTSRRRSKSNVNDEDDLLDYKTCYDLLVELMRHPSSWPFLAPVSKKDAPGYHTIIKRPMDFGTIRSKLNNMSYRSNEEFVQDLYLVLQNCEFFNPRYSEEYKAARVLHKEVKRLLQEYNLANSISSKIEQNFLSPDCI